MDRFQRDVEGWLESGTRSERYTFVYRQGILVSLRRLSSLFEAHREDVPTATGHIEWLIVGFESVAGDLQPMLPFQQVHDKREVRLLLDFMAVDEHLRINRIDDELNVARLGTCVGLSSERL